MPREEFQVVSVAWAEVRWREVLPNALPAVACQQRPLQVDRSAVAVDSGSRLNEDPECGCRDGRDNLNFGSR